MIFKIFTCISIFLYKISFSYARPVQPPGYYVGTQLGKPLKTGIHFLNLFNYNSFPSGKVPSTNLLINSPKFIYSTPKEILKGKLEFWLSLPQVFYRNQGRKSWVGNVYNPFIGSGLAWQLNPFWSFSYWSSIWLPMNTQGLSNDSFVFQEQGIINFKNDDNEATVNFIYGLPQKSNSKFKPSLPNYINLDLTFTKIFGNLSLGPIAYGSWDVSKANPWSQFAVGGIIGYNFNQVSFQFWLAKDTNENHWGTQALSGFFRIRFPLLNN